MHYFHKSLQNGKKGELQFLELAKSCNWLLTQTDGRAGDFVTQSGEKVELKTDSYDHDSTGNLFIEFYSDIDKGKLGGPAQAQMHGCKYFVYFFSKNKIAYVFDVDDLCKQLLTIDLGKPKDIRNVRWTTRGYAVPRTLLKHVRVLK